MSEATQISPPTHPTHTDVSDVTTIDIVGEHVARLSAVNATALKTGLSVEWLLSENEHELGVNGLGVIEEAVELAAKLGEDIREWESRFSPGEVISMVTFDMRERVMALNDDNTDDESDDDTDGKRPSKGARKAARKAKAEARRNANATNAAVPDAKDEPAGPEPGSVVQTEHGTRFVCSGKRGKCRSLMSAEHANVTSNKVRLKKELGVEFGRHILPGDIRECAAGWEVFCPSCCAKSLRDGSRTLQSVIDDAEKVTYADTLKSGRMLARSLGYEQQLPERVLELLGLYEEAVIDVRENIRRGNQSRLASGEPTRPFPGPKAMLSIVINWVPTRPQKTVAPADDAPADAPAEE